MIFKDIQYFIFICSSWRTQIRRNEEEWTKNVPQTVLQTQRYDMTSKDPCHSRNPSWRSHTEIPTNNRRHPNKSKKNFWPILTKPNLKRLLKLDPKPAKTLAKYHSADFVGRSAKTRKWDRRHDADVHRHQVRYLRGMK